MNYACLANHIFVYVIDIGLIGLKCENSSGNNINCPSCWTMIYVSLFCNHVKNSQMLEKEFWLP